MRHAVGIVFLLGAGLTGVAVAEPQFAGHWTGTYRCQGQPEAKMALEIAPSERPLHEGVFTFDAAGVKGSYTVTGRAQSNGQFTIVARTWVDQPEGFRALGLRGRIGSDGQSMDGSLQGCPNGNFVATRLPSAGKVASQVQPMRLPEGDATPPVSFGGAIGGALAEATSAEAQCRALAGWYAPAIGPRRFDGMPSHQIIEAIAPLFVDETFEPVFGIPVTLLDETESRAVGHFIKQTCYGTLGMEPYRNVFSDVFRSPAYVGRITAIHERQAEAARWAAATREELAGIRIAGADALEKLRVVDTGIARSRLPDEATAPLRAEAAALRVELETAARNAKTASLIADLRNVGENLDQGHLGTALRVADQARASDLTPEQITQVVDAARHKAAAILEPRLIAAAGLATDLPASLDGLKQARAALRPFEQYRASMDKTFGSIDPDGTLAPLYRRIRDLESDRAVLAELQTALSEAAQGERPREAVETLGAQVSGPNGWSAGIGALVSAARDQAEIAAVLVEDRSTNPDPAEPTAREIAAFALQRVRTASARMADMESACTSGRITDPVAAMACLANPAVWTGQTGSGATLLRVTKLGCVPEHAQAQYRCTFVQEIRIDIAGGEAFGAGRWSDLSQQLSSGEAVDARFIRAASGWSIVWGDLR
ncbi:hypothetical protein JQ506_16450 [Shinella sp. PSBB067]|uniref:hypothetical protein n=1 Tax=Shinella sp. PSBB067 TaxID=2715959 RepID=UPI000928DAE5|nr:hypothetical protein [Shinella sp. PSBB067]MBN9053404.1 hypothetical protein [Hyphomicrobiales bacterium]OJU86257.1 MAG: hypothetical protein BGO06_28065 [Shinella sp. 65-6]QRI62440.1 hypothetical protein JQ506_16450 [Shinella sp. PSBB067]